MVTSVWTLLVGTFTEVPVSVSGRDSLLQRRCPTFLVGRTYNDPDPGSTHPVVVGNPSWDGTDCRGVPRKLGCPLKVLRSLCAPRGLFCFSTMWGGKPRSLNHVKPNRFPRLTFSHSLWTLTRPAPVLRTSFITHPTLASAEVTLRFLWFFLT